MVISYVMIAVVMLIRLKYNISYTPACRYSVLYVPGSEAILASNFVYIHVPPNSCKPIQVYVSLECIVVLILM